MSAATPDHVLMAIYNNARGIGDGPAMTQQEWQSLVGDMGSWFTWWGVMVDIRAKSIGGGLYLIEGSFR